MIPIKKCQPVDALLLVRSQSCLNSNRDLKGLHFVDIEHLGDEFPFTIASLKEFLRESWWVRDTGLEWNQLHKSGEGRCCDETDIVIGIAHTAENGHD